MNKQAKPSLRAKNAVERGMNLVFLLCGFIAIAFVVLITIYLIISGLPAIKEVGLIDFLFGTRWASTDKTNPAYGILPFMLTSIYGTAGALSLIHICGGIGGAAGVGAQVQKDGAVQIVVLGQRLGDGFCGGVTEADALDHGHPCLLYTSGRLSQQLRQARPERRGHRGSADPPGPP